MLQAAMPTVFDRAVARQAKDTQRYRNVRSRDLPPRMHRYKVGDFVYVRQRKINTLDVAASRTILRVREVLPTGVLVLEGADGGTHRTTVGECAPCHLPNLITNPDGVAADLPCELCQSPTLADPMLLCDTCNRGYHISCLTPPLTQVPPGDWHCPVCQPPD